MLFSLIADKVGEDVSSLIMDYKVQLEVAEKYKRVLQELKLVERVKLMFYGPVMGWFNISYFSTTLPKFQPFSEGLKTRLLNMEYKVELLNGKMLYKIIEFDYDCTRELYKWEEEPFDYDLEDSYYAFPISALTNENVILNFPPDENAYGSYYRFVNMSLKKTGYKGPNIKHFSLNMNTM